MRLDVKLLPLLSHQLFVKQVMLKTRLSASRPTAKSTRRWMPNRTRR